MSEQERYVLVDANGEGLALAEAPSRFDAEFYGATHFAAEGYAYSRTPDEYRAAHDQLRKSWKRRYLAEGRSEEVAESMAEAAAGPMKWPPKVFVERQESALRTPRPGKTGDSR